MQYLKSCGESAHRCAPDHRDAELIDAMGRIDRGGRCVHGHDEAVEVAPGQEDLRKEAVSCPAAHTGDQARSVFLQLITRQNVGSVAPDRFTNRDGV